MKSSGYGKILISIFVSIILMIGIVGILGKVALNKTLLDPDLYSQTLLENDFYPLFPTLLGNMGARGGLIELNPEWDQEFINIIGEGTFVSILNQIFSTDWIQQQMQSVILELIDFIKGNSEMWIPGINLIEVRDGFTGNISNITAARLMQVLPACNSEQQSAWEVIVIQQSAESVPFCQPPIGVSIDAQFFIREQLSYLVAMFPDRLEITQFIRADLWTSNVISVLSGIKYLYQVISLSPWLAICAGAILAWINRWSFAGIAKWFSVSFISAGIIVFGLVASGLIFVNQTAFEISNSLISEAPESIVVMVNGIILQLSSTTAFWLALTGLGSLVCGVTLLLVAAILPGEIKEGEISIKLKTWKRG